MVTRRADGAERIVDLTRHQDVDGFKDSAHCQICGIIGLGAHLVVRMFKDFLSRKACITEPVDIGTVMDRFNPFPVRGFGCNVVQMGKKASLLYPFVYGGESIRNFRVVWTGLVEQIPFVI